LKEEAFALSGKLSSAGWWLFRWIVGSKLPKHARVTTQKSEGLNYNAAKARNVAMGRSLER
jgi:hypothetical protein